MITSRLYQTVENRENPDEVESRAPFKCTKYRAWLGEGYYFWDTFDQYAHRWGEEVYQGNYFICEVICKYWSHDVLDLVGNTTQIYDFGEITKVLEKEYHREVTVPFVINYLQTKTSFGYKMIRAHSENAFSRIEPLRLRFVEDNKSTLNLRPIIQCCVIDKSILLLPVKIVYPPEYVNASCI
jgi:hypothetical protein